MNTEPNTTMNEDQRLDKLWPSLKQQIRAARRERSNRMTAPESKYDSRSYFHIGGPRELNKCVYLVTSNGGGWHGTLNVERPACLQLAADAVAAFMDLQDAKL